jgi:thiol-disulfide isomerase/thioredoxin
MPATGRLVALVLVGIVLTGCTVSPSTVDSGASGGAGCLRSAVPSAGAADQSSATPAAGATAATAGGAIPAGSAVPDVTLACLSGGGSVRLAKLAGPLLVNVWASWCEPCRAELPAVQSFAVKAAGKVTVLGVDAGDTRAKGTSLLQDLKITYPSLYDDQQRLLKALGRQSLPLTMFITGTGHLVHVYNSTPLDEPAIEHLSATYLGVRI